MLRNSLFFAYLIAGIGTAYLDLNGQIDDRMSARVLGVLTVLVCLTALFIKRRIGPDQA